MRMVENPKRRFRDFIIRVKSFRPTYGSSGLGWCFNFPDAKKRWHDANIILRDGTYYVVSFSDRWYWEVRPDGSCGSSEGVGGDFRGFPTSIWFDDAVAWMTFVRRNWIKAHLFLEAEYPIELRTGIVPRQIALNYTDCLYSARKDLGENKSKEFIDLVASGYFMKSPTAGRTMDMTARRYFEYCRIAYLAAKSTRKDVGVDMSGEEMYRKLSSDGRNGTIYDLDQDSPDEFAEWCDGRGSHAQSGGHPTRITKGGGSTSIHLNFGKIHELGSRVYTMELFCEELTLLADVVRMFFALKEAGLPVGIRDSEIVARRLCETDDVGVIPVTRISSHYAWHAFSTESCIRDVVWLSDFGRRRRLVLPFITWQPLPLLVPVKEAK